MEGLGVSHQLSSSARVGGHYQLLDHACGDCVACEAGWPVCCERPTSGRPLCSVPEGFDSTEALGLLAASSAFLSAAVPDEAVVLAVAHKSQESILDLLNLVHSGTVLFATGPRDALVKKRLTELSAVGRADVVVSLLSGRDGVLAVKRGGTVCLGDGRYDMPSVTELAQREVRVVGPRDNAQLVKQVGRESVEKVFERSSKVSLQLR